MTPKINYLELFVERMADADERRRNHVAQWQGDLYSPHDIERLRNELRPRGHPAMATDADKELARYTDAYVERNLHGGVPFPSCGLAVLAILDTADRLSDFVRLAFVQEITRRLLGWIDDEESSEIPFDFCDSDDSDDAAGYVAVIEYPIKSECLVVQGGSGREYQSDELVLGAFNPRRP